MDLNAIVGTIVAYLSSVIGRMGARVSEKISDDLGQRVYNWSRRACVAALSAVPHWTDSN